MHYIGEKMFKNYFKIAFRTIKKHIGYSFINVTGLAIGMACSILMLLYVINELSYDRFHDNAERIYRLAVRASIGNTKIRQTYSSAITFQKLLEDFPEIETGLKFYNFRTVPVILETKTFYESRFFAVDSVFFDVFTFPLIHGNPKTALIQPNTMVISKNTAIKYFGDTNVIGKVIKADLSNNGFGNIDFKITGVSENVPPNSHFHYDMLVSFVSFPTFINDTGWTSNNFISYIILKQGTSKNEFEAKLKDFTRKYMGGERFDKWVAKGNYWEYYLQPLTKIHLNSDLNGEFEANGNETYVYIFAVLCIIILLVACINFMNLSTAKSSLRAKEVGIRKVVGSSRIKLIRQFLSESVLLSFISLAFGLIIVECLLPSYRNLIGRQIEINYFDNYFAIPLIITLGLFVGIVSGSYPAFFLSSFKPITVLKSNLNQKKTGSWLRNILVIFQFAVSIFLIIATLTIYKQLKYFQHRKLGFEKEQVLVINNPRALGNNVIPLKETLRKHNNISDVSGSNTLPGRNFSNIGFGAEGIDEGFTLNLCICDHNFLKTLKLELAQGRFFSQNFSTDSCAIILNEKAVELLGWENPIGKKLNNGSRNRGDFTVVGVVKDYHYESLHQKIRPMALFLSGGYYKNNENCISVRFKTDNISETIKYIENTWNDFAFNKPFEYSFMDEDFDALYMNEQYTRRVSTIFTSIAMFIACLGLFGLASFMADRKTKEFGIRKVLGASVSNLVLHFTNEFTKWVLLANVIAWPVAWFVMDKWLQNFSYRINITWLSFVFAGALALLIALLTVSFQAIRSSLTNPVKSLRYE